MRTLLIFLALCACASAQPFAPLQYHRTASAPAAFKPSDLDSLKFWVAADSITGKSAGDTVGIWRDLSPSKVNAVQGTASKKPIYYADSLGGRPTLYFDGSDDYVEADGIVCDNATLTAYVVAKRRTYRNNAVTVGLRSSPTVNDYSEGNAYSILLFADSSAGRMVGYRGYTFFEWIGGANGAQGNAYYSMSLTTGTYNSLQVNGSGTNIDPTSGVLRGHVLAVATRYQGAPGGSYQIPWNGHIAEIIIYSTALSDADRGKVETYLKTKYGL